MRNHGDQQRRRREGLSRFDANDGGDGRDLEAPPGFAEVLLDAATSSPPEMCSATRPGLSPTEPNQEFDRRLLASNPSTRDSRVTSSRSTKASGSRSSHIQEGP
jgi:hypothetical protein